METNDVQLLEFFSSYPLISFTKGEVLYRPGDEFTFVYLLKEGLVKQHVLTPQGQDVLFMIYKPDSIFPLLEILGGQHNRYFWQASTDGFAHKVSLDIFLPLLRSKPQLLLDFATRVARGVDGLLHHMEYVMSARAMQQVTNVLITTAKRFGTPVNGEIRLQLTHQDIASQTGLSRETVTRTLTQLKEKELIGHSGRTLIITDLGKLEKNLG